MLIDPIEARFDPYGLVEYPNEVSFMLTQASKRILKEYDELWHGKNINKEKSNDQD